MKPAWMTEPHLGLDGRWRNSNGQVVCNDPNPDGAYVCSLDQDHVGDHEAFRRHDLNTHLAATWPCLVPELLIEEWP